ncbi:hypothetical protein P7K49_013468 [Saguinus oedipus]|uniref:Uncharacterized protein n=1 Tax=Saguinus oedipus TaxID=9490 RepID=A0ABQ9VFZ8_SAGOE|nr:hypothetical protein P7K49_013468 [Saguinus oedipus]
MENTLLQDQASIEARDQGNWTDAESSGYCSLCQEEQFSPRGGLKGMGRSSQANMAAGLSLTYLQRSSQKAVADGQGQVFPTFPPHGLWSAEENLPPEEDSLDSRMRFGLESAHGTMEPGRGMPELSLYSPSGS